MGVGHSFLVGRGRDWHGDFAPMLLLTVCFCLILCSVPASAAMTVVGSSNGRECFLNATTGEGSDEAISVCRSALAFDALRDRDRAATFVNLGIVLTHATKHDEAHEAFDQAESLRPKLAEAMINRGNTYFHQRDFPRALKEYGRSLETDTTKRAEAYVNRGLVYEYIRNYPAAARNYACALVHKPVFAKADRGIDRVRSKGHEVPVGCPSTVAEE